MPREYFQHQDGNRDTAAAAALAALLLLLLLWLAVGAYPPEEVPGH